VPEGKRGLLKLWAAILSAEINVYYTYALLGLSHGHPALAIHAENMSTATDALRRHRFVVLAQSDLQSDFI